MEQPLSKIRRLIIGASSIIIVLLLIVIVSLLLFWQPWDKAITANTRKITITGEASVKAEPDQFQFNPTYNRDTTPEVTKLNDEIVAKLKTLGVADNQIKNNANRYGSPEIYYKMPVDGGKQQTTLSLTITVDKKELAQKVQDYLLTTDPEGSVTPYPTFSTAKQKELENKVRSQAVADARKKADDTVKGLGAKVGKVIEITEGSSGGGSCGSGAACPARDTATSDGSDSSGQSLSIQPGTDEFTYSLSVIFSIE